METYPQPVMENILPLSLAKTLPEAFTEWFFTEKTIDYGSPIAKCNLCDNEKLRYHFEINNENNGNKLFIGSKCIIKFQLRVFENGNVLSTKGVIKKLNRLINDMRKVSCIKALVEIASFENNNILKSALAYYQKHQYLTPKFAFVVFWRLKKTSIDFTESFFKITLKTESNKRDLKEMPHERVLMFWNALSPAQKKIAQQLGHKPPI